MIDTIEKPVGRQNPATKKSRSEKKSRVLSPESGNGNKTPDSGLLIRALDIMKM